MTNRIPGQADTNGQAEPDADDSDATQPATAGDLADAVEQVYEAALEAINDLARRVTEQTTEAAVTAARAAVDKAAHDRGAALDALRAEFDDKLTELREAHRQEVDNLIRAFMSQPPPSFTVNLPPTEPPVIENNYTMPAGAGSSPPVVVNVPESPAPVIHVNAPCYRKTIQYDQAGRPVEIEESPISKGGICDAS